MVPDDDTIDFLFHASSWWLSEFGGFAEFRAEKDLDELRAVTDAGDGPYR